jgi:ATP-dependent DNA helicase RecG
LRFADPERDARLIERARDCAAHMLAEHPQASEAHVRRWLGVRTAMLAA